MSKTVYTQDKLFKRIDEMCSKNIKLTRENLIDFDKQAYENSIDLFGTWKLFKSRYNDYCKLNSTKEMKMNKIMFKEFENMSKKYDMSVFNDNAINKEFLNVLEQKESFYVSVVECFYDGWDSFIDNYSSFKNEFGFTNEQVLVNIKNILKNETKIDDAVISKKYTEVYNFLCNKYGNFNNALIYFISNNSQENDDESGAV